MKYTAVVLVIVVALLSGSLSGDEPEKTSSANVEPAVDRAAGPVSSPHEMLNPDASWCGPRVLYFFSIYLGRERSLEDVIAICHTDQAGLTSLADLTRAAEELGLQPTPVRCSADDLSDFNGPAIVSLSNREGGPVHFVGVLGQEEGQFVVLDPAWGVHTRHVRKERIARSFTGHAILMGGTGASRVRWLGPPAMFAFSACWAVVLIAYLRPESISRLAARCRERWCREMWS